MQHTTESYGPDPFYPRVHLSSCLSLVCFSQLVGVCVRLRKLVSITVLYQLKEELNLFLIILN